MRRLILALLVATPLFALASTSAAASGWCNCGCRSYGYYGYSTYRPYYSYYRPYYYYRPRVYSGGFFYRQRAWGWRGYGYRAAGWRGYGYRGWRGGRRW